MFDGVCSCEVLDAIVRKFTRDPLDKTDDSRVRIKQCCRSLSFGCDVDGEEEGGVVGSIISGGVEVSSPDADVAKVVELSNE